MAMQYFDRAAISSRRQQPPRVALGVLVVGILVVVATGSCKLPSSGSETTGLTVSVSAANPRTLVPNIDMNAVSYAIAGTGPGGATFSTTLAAGASTTIASLVSGAWTVTATGQNAAGTLITFGSATAQVSTGTVSTVAITATPIVGPGSLSLTVSWPTASVAAPSIQAQLLPATGSATTLAFSTPANGSSSYSGSGIMNGYYTLTIQLFDGSTLVMGAVDVVEIVQGQTTSGTYAFSTVNNKGVISVNISPNPLNPITVTMSGQQATVASGTPVTLSATVPAGTGNVTYAWYVNGVSQALGTSFTLNSSTSPLSIGTYRVDVTAFTANGARAGSATTTVTVAALDAVTLMWNANTDTGLAGYKLYTGTASGVYGTPATLGMVTTTTVPTLLSGVTYYFALTAFNTAGMESSKSAEISYKAP